MQREISKQEVIFMLDRLSQVKEVESTQFNYAVNRSIDFISPIVTRMKKSLNYTPEMQKYTEDKGKIVAKYFKEKDHVLTDEEQIQLREEIEEYAKNNEDVYRGRIRQVNSYHQQLREKIDITFHGLPFSSTHIPENISIANLFNAAYILDWKTWMKTIRPDAPIQVEPATCMNVFKIIPVLINVFVSNPEQQHVFNIKMAYNLFSMYQEMVKIIISPEYTKWMAEYDSKRVELSERFAAKDIYGDPQMDKNEFVIEDQAGFNEAISALSEEVKETIDAKNKLLETPININVYQFSLDMFPNNLTTEVMAELTRFIKFEEEETPVGPGNE